MKRAKPARRIGGNFGNTFKQDPERGKRLLAAKEKIFDPLQEVLKAAGKDPRLGWTVVGSHVNEFMQHGFCARNLLSKSLPAEKFLIPSFTNSSGWTPFDPWEYRTYETRQRWVRLPVDSKLSVDHRRSILGIEIDFGFEDNWSTIMHPTAEGLAVNADANLAAISGFGP